MGSESSERKALIVTTNNFNNSNKARRESEERSLPATSERREVKPAIKRNKPKEETFWSKLRYAVFGNVALKDVPAHLVLNVFVPAMKQTMYDVVCNGFGMAFDIKEGGRKRDRGSSGYGGYFSSRRDRDDDRDNKRDYNKPETYREVWFESYQDAVDVYNSMLDYCDDQGYVTVLEFYALADLKSPRPDRDDRKGWAKSDLRNPDIFKGRDGYFYIDLPRPTVIDNL